MSRAGFLAVVLGAALMAGPALAETVTTEELQAALRQRDQVIVELQQRVAALEARRAAPQANIETISAAAPSPAPAVEQDEAELQALSRGLVQRGLLLLPRGGVEISPSLAYSHSQEQGLVLVDTPEGISTVSSQRRREDGVEATLAARYGLPWRSQVQVRVPFDWKRDASALGDGSQVSNSDTHIGDVELELSHQFLTEDERLPALTAAFGWRFPTGRDPFDAPVVSVASGQGTNVVTARLTALKSLDPLVIFTGVSYSASLSRREHFGRVRPGDQLGWNLGALLAVSPETSLNFGFSQQFKGHTRVDGQPIAGSDGVAGVVQLGLDQVLSSRALLDVSLGIGLTDDAPDYQLLVSIPIRLR